MGYQFLFLFFFLKYFFNSQLRKTILKISEFLDNKLKAVFREMSLSETIFIFISIFLLFLIILWVYFLIFLQELDIYHLVFCLCLSCFYPSPDPEDIFLIKYIIFII